MHITLFVVLWLYFLLMNIYRLYSYEFFIGVFELAVCLFDLTCKPSLEFHISSVLKQAKWNISQSYHVRLETNLFQWISKTVWNRESLSSNQEIFWLLPWTISKLSEEDNTYLMESYHESAFLSVMFNSMSARLKTFINLAVLSCVKIYKYIYCYLSVSSYCRVLSRVSVVVWN